MHNVDCSGAVAPNVAPMPCVLATIARYTIRPRAAQLSRYRYGERRNRRAL